MLNISAILSAVPPREQTDQYVILATMYSLGAYDKPVTSTQVKEVLTLHLGNKTPGNIPGCLRKYKANVEAVEKGPPLLWSLTQNGVEHLRSVSGLALATTLTAADFDYDIGIICALEQPELDAVVKAMGGGEKWSSVSTARFSHLYRETTLTTSTGRKLKVVATTSTSMGLTAAAIATTQLIFQFRPRLVMMIGIAAGTRTGNKRYGDVLVADPSVDYSSGKVEFKEGIRAFLPDPYPLGINARLRSVLHKYRGVHPVFTQIRDSWDGNVPDGINRVHIGPLGAADQVIDDESRITEIQNNWRKLIGVEMETYGVYRACHEAPEPKPRFVSFKSVCDFAAAKSDSWQEYAAYVAAEFAAGFLKTEWDAIWPPPAGKG